MNHISDEEFIKEYDATMQVGQIFISNHWHRLDETTKNFLIKDGVWNERGLRSKDDSFSDVDGDLEYTIGFLNKASVSLPARSEPNTEISGYVFSDNVIESCYSILDRKEWHDPVFLRLALAAVRSHEMANLLVCLPVKKRPSAFNILWVAFLFVTFPFLTTATLLAISQNDGLSAYFLSYFVAICFISLWNISNKISGKGLREPLKNCRFEQQ